MDIKSVSVIGAGQMGNGIAHVFALADFNVRLFDISPDARDAALATIESNLNRAIARSLITEADKTHQRHGKCNGHPHQYQCQQYTKPNQRFGHEAIAPDLSVL